MRIQHGNALPSGIAQRPGVVSSVCDAAFDPGRVGKLPQKNSVYGLSQIRPDDTRGSAAFAIWDSDIV